MVAHIKFFKNIAVFHFKNWSKNVPFLSKKDMSFLDTSIFQQETPQIVICDVT